MKNKIIATILILIILEQFCTFVFAQDNNSLQSNEVSNETTNEINDDTELDKQREELENKIGTANVQLEYVQDELSDTMLMVQETEDQVMQYEQEIQDMQTQMDDLQLSINDATNKLAVASQDYNTKKEILAQRLVAMYEAGDTEYLDVLLKSTSIIDFISRYYIIEEMAEYDNELINQVKTEKDTIETTRQQLETQQDEIQSIKAQSEQATIVLSNMRTLQQSYIDQLSEDEKELQEQITAYKQDQLAIEEQIMLATGMNVDIQYSGGEMLWPVAASGTVITSNFGMREHPIQGVVKQHTGLDIAGVPSGTPVVAAADGVVTYAGWLGGYGNCVMINHGDGVVTLYGHGSEILTTVGTEVKQGDVILAVGSTGNSTGPHLHFEVRVNGQYTNPLNYVKIP